MNTQKRYKWVTIDSKTSEDLERDCKKQYPGYIIVERSFIKVDYEREKPYRQVFILRKFGIRKSEKSQ